MFCRAYASGAIQDFKQRILDNLLRLHDETGAQDLAFPVGVFLALDRKNGGDETGEEIARRFNFVDSESRDVIDFYLLGWHQPRSTETQPVFDLASFQSCRDALKKAGVEGFGGYADFLFFDAWLRDGRAVLDFENALHVDLAESLASKRIPNVGGFVQHLIDAANEVRKEANTDFSAVLRVSDKVGLATAKQSALNFVLRKWGAIIGASALLPLATRRIGPAVDLAEI